MLNTQGLNTHSPIMTILCVDDEENILKSLRRTLGRQKLKVLLATSGQEALEILEHEQISLIISDMKMPHMSGTQLLTLVSQQYPDVYRMLLTGYADIESTISAINQGKIARYLQKPWKNDELLEAVKEGLLSVNSKKLKRLHYSTLTHDLKHQVHHRTKQVQSAVAKIKSNKHAAEKVFYNLISVTPHLSGAFAKNVSKLALLIAEQLNDNSISRHELALAGLLCEIGLVGVSKDVTEQPFNQLSYAKKQAYLGQIDVARLILAPAVYLSNVSDTICYQFKKLNEPHALAIPLSAKILAVARDFWRMKLGRINGVEMSDAMIKNEMLKYRGIHYDEMIIAALHDITDKSEQSFQTDENEHAVPLHSLQIGMVLKEHIFNQADILLLPQGHVFTELSIERLINLQVDNKQSLKSVLVA